jgi:hypothetical protein
MGHEGNPILRRIHMTTRQEVYRSGIGLFCRYGGIQMCLESVVLKMASLQEAIAKRFSDAAVAKAVCRKKSGFQRVFEIIHESENGVAPSIIKKATGFKEQKIAKILHTLFKYGEIRIEPGGLYVAVAGR